MRESICGKLWFRNLVLIGIPSVISVLGVIISFVPNNIKIIMGCSSIFLIICLIIAVLSFASRDNMIEEECSNLRTENNKLKVIADHLNNVVKTNACSINSFGEFAGSWSKSINLFANEVSQNGMVQGKHWDKLKLFDEVCFQCRNMIKCYCDKDDNTKISVGYVSYRKDNEGEEWVSLIAHSSPSSTKPHSYGGEENLLTCKYHYADLIKNNFSDIEVAVNNDEILRKFKNVSINTDLSKYSQYIAIPIYCSSKKLLGIFQIVTKYDYIIEENHIALRKFAEENIIPFSNMILLIDKINKGLYAKPQEERNA